MTAHEIHHPRRWGSWALTALAVVCLLLGITLLAGGIWLILLGGSWYYGIAGLGLLLVGVLLFRRSFAAVWLYLAVWAGTVVWAFWEVGTDWWAQMPRLVGPTLILILVLLCIPALRRR
ncbi:quinoprotein glucose dehydrogenase [[Luteovulum] sphaeroides subsp. megalophilum]|jgi:quinoprotein glucose dehydrogenase|uniref:hypothetical protein n=1 Tax=Cereibacter sphaeroides TaxID=1063 RepID=UPI0000664669|nr:hypothetical protein [Cereibacter sphaeroides]ABN78629.1 Glucose dehydrogenase-like protein [Cereibacter sphaeroides ATCC 17029]SNT22246.1 quinoprotein glucose dehydrogenase [[Luteovulum] sphaeroides subsp. megalophilum]